MLIFAAAYHFATVNRQIMLIVQNILISDDVIHEQFACNLSACKGACCWEGDYGAPLADEELPILEQIYATIAPFLSEEGKAVIEEKGAYYYDEEAEGYTTPLINGGPCAYLTYDELGVASCGIEKAYFAGLIGFRKPISCHLYPIRVNRNKEGSFQALNYDRWDICSAACSRGKEEKIAVFEFVKEALIRAYGQAFYDELAAAAAFIKPKKE